MKTAIAQSATTLFYIASLVLLPVQQALAATITKEYYHYNHQGSPIGVYDGKGNELLIQRWTAWGERQVLKASAPATSTGALLKHGLPAHMGYTGHKGLVAAGLVLIGDTRLYSPRHKRFLNPDDRTTGGIRGENRFSYAYNNPIRFIDPDGHVPWLWDRLFGGAGWNALMTDDRPTIEPVNGVPVVEGILLVNVAQDALENVVQGQHVPTEYKMIKYAYALTAIAIVGGVSYFAYDHFATGTIEPATATEATSQLGRNFNATALEEEMEEIIKMESITLGALGRFRDR